MKQTPFGTVLAALLALGAVAAVSTDTNDAWLSSHNMQTTVVEPHSTIQNYRGLSLGEETPTSTDTTASPQDVLASQTDDTSVASDYLRRHGYGNQLKVDDIFALSDEVSAYQFTREGSLPRTTNVITHAVILVSNGHVIGGSVEDNHRHWSSLSGETV